VSEPADDDETGGEVGHLLDDGARLGAARRVIGRAHEAQRRRRVVEHPFDLAEVEAEVGAALPLDDGRRCQPADLAVHGVGRLEDGGRPTRPPVGQEQGLEDLVAAVGGEDLVGMDAVQRSEGLAQVAGAPVGVAVERDALELGGDVVDPFHRWRER
jgi:hypothetical protein